MSSTSTAIEHLKYDLHQERKTVDEISQWSRPVGRCRAGICTRTTYPVSKSGRRIIRADSGQSHHAGARYLVHGLGTADGMSNGAS